MNLYNFQLEMLTSQDYPCFQSKNKYKIYVSSLCQEIGIHIPTFKLYPNIY